MSEPRPGDVLGRLGRSIPTTALLTISVATLAAAALGAGAISGGAGDAPKPGPEGEETVVEVFRRSTGGGYGYRISTDDGVVIHQPHVPAVSGELGFASARDARAVAGLVVQRMKSGIFPPAVSRRDLDALGVRSSDAVATRPRAGEPLPSVDASPYRRKAE